MDGATIAMAAATGAEEKREARRARILDAAARVFSERPFAQASMDEIAGQAGVGKPTLYRYFPGKDALFATVFSVVLDGLEDRLGTVLGEELDTGETLRRMLAEIVPTFREHLVPLRYLSEGDAIADQSRRRVFRERRARIAGRLAAALERGAARGEVRPAAAALAQMMLGMVRSATAATDATDAEIVDAVTDVVLNGLVAGRASPEHSTAPNPRPRLLLKASA